jgi:hypothetical protein
VAFAGVVVWALRGVALLAGGVLVWLVPVTVYRCETAGAGTARCRIESARAGIEPVEAEDIAGIASADSVPDRLTLRLLDASGDVLHARSGPAVVGASSCSWPGACRLPCPRCSGCRPADRLAARRPRPRFARASRLG